MKVALLKSRSNSQGGLEKYASRIASAFVEKGAEVSILSTGTKDKNSEIPIYTTQTVPWPAFIRMEQFDWFVKKWLKKHQPDLVFGMDRNRFQTHIRAGNGVHAAYLEARVFTEGKRKAFFCRLNPLHRKILELEKAAFENPRLQKLFTNSRMVKDQVLYYYNTDPKKVEVIHNGVEWEEMQNDFDQWEIVKPRVDSFQFLFIGHGYLRKGLEKLLVGLSRLQTRDFQLTVVGKDNQIDFFRTRAVQLGLQNHVLFVGPSKEIIKHYQRADCLVIPSFYDPFANVTIEALAMGLFVVSSKQNGGSEVLNDQNGVIIENLLDPDSMTEALEVALKCAKTKTRAQKIRASVKHLDFSNQLEKMMGSCG